MGLRFAAAGDAQPKRASRRHRRLNMRRSDGNDDTTIGLRDVGLGGYKAGFRQKNQQADR